MKVTYVIIIAIVLAHVVSFYQYFALSESQRKLAAEFHRTKAEFEKHRKNYRDLTVIPYCTVGGRSGAYAQQLAESGVKVKNYKGSILDWVQHKLPLVTRDGQPTNRVHTYSSRYRVPRGYQSVTR